MRILVVEDQTLLRRHLLEFVGSCFPQSSVTEATTVDELRRFRAENTHFDLAVVDLDLPDGNALEWIVDVKKDPQSPKIVILSSETHEYVIYKALHADVSGFVHKNDSHAVLATALRTVVDGGIYFSPTVNGLRMQMQSSPDFCLKILSTREQQILRLIGQNYTDAEIAEQLSIRQSTIGSHRKNIMAKLGLHSREQLFIYSKEKGFDRLSAP